MQCGAVRCERRAVAWAIPAALEAVPKQMAPEMRTGGGRQKQLSIVIAGGGNVAQPLADDSALTGLSSSHDESSPGATYSAKFLTAVRFSLTNIPAALSGLRAGS